MSKLDDLLQGVKVEWKQLDDIAQYIRGLTYNKTNESKDNSGLKVLRANNITLNNNSLNFDEIKYVNLNTKVKESQKLYSNDILISAASGSRDHVGKVAYINTDLDYYFGGFMGVVRSSSTVNSRYLFHILTSGIFKKYVDDALNTATINNLSSSMMNAFKIPIPCPDNPEKSLEVQQEIVRILDQLTETTNNLKNELESERQIRKKQFEFYREQLLSFEKNDIEWKEIKDIFNLKNGYTPSKSKQEYWEDGTIPWFRMEDIRKNGRVLKEAIQKINISAIKGGKLFPANSLIVATSATIGEHALVKVPYLSNQRFTNLSLKEEYTLKYNVEFLNYYCFILDEWCKNNTTIGNFAGVDMTKFKKFMFPIPPLEEQERIVNLLDQFDAAHTAIEEEITKEIKLRTQQYEYYREKLLTFSKN